MEGIPGIWKCNVCGVRECCSACAGVSPLVTKNTRVRFNLIEIVSARLVNTGANKWRRVIFVFNDIAIHVAGWKAALA
eukprot:1161108-Pelagomonas_calceolata.AAC.2